MNQKFIQILGFGNTYPTKPDTIENQNGIKMALRYHLWKRARKETLKVMSP